MQRRRQITQDIPRAMDVAFLPDGAVAELEEREKVVITERSSRVEGRALKVPVVKEYLAQAAIYNSLQELMITRRQSRLLAQSEQIWQPEHIPAEAFEACDAWGGSVVAPSDQELLAASEGIVAQPYDRQNDTIDCPSCPADTKYACHASGWTRELYRYPMIEVRSTVGESYEIPFDVAAYAVSVPGGVGLETDYRINQSNGELSAERLIKVTKNYVTRDYVKLVTGGEVIPEADKLEFVEAIYVPTDSRIVVDTWTESGRVYPRHEKKELDAESAIDVLQKTVAFDCLEKVDGIDHNARFDAVRRALGVRGLGMTFGVEAHGMGDYSLMGYVYDPDKRQKKDAYMGIDYSEVLGKMHQRLVKKDDTV